MATIKSLLEAGKLDEAADELLNTLHYLVNSVPGMDLTKDEFDELVPVLKDKLEDPSSVIPEDTNEPGDDVGVYNSISTLTISFIGPKNDPKFTAPDPVVIPKTVGSDYEFFAPEIPGYIASPDYIRGTMEGIDKNLVVGYSAVTKPPKYGTAVICGTAKGNVDDSNPAEIVVTYEPTELEFGKKHNDYTNEHLDSWFVGVEVDSPEGMYKKKDFEGATITLADDLTGTANGPMEFWDTLGSAEQNNENKPKKDPCWFSVNEEKFEAARQARTGYNKQILLDWNGDGNCEQIIHIYIDPEKITLKPKADEPAAEEPAAEEAPAEEASHSDSPEVTGTPETSQDPDPNPEPQTQDSDTSEDDTAEAESEQADGTGDQTTPTEPAEESEPSAPEGESSADDSGPSLEEAPRPEPEQTQQPQVEEAPAEEEVEP